MHLIQSQKWNGFQLQQAGSSLVIMVGKHSSLLPPSSSSQPSYLQLILLHFFPHKYPNRMCQNENEKCAKWKICMIGPLLVGFFFILPRITWQTERSDLIITVKWEMYIRIFIKPARQAPEEGDNIFWDFSYPLILKISKILHLWSMTGNPKSIPVSIPHSWAWRQLFIFLTKDKYNLCNLIIKFIPDSGSVQVPHYPMELECTEMHNYLMVFSYLSSTICDCNRFSDFPCIQTF